MTIALEKTWLVGKTKVSEATAVVANKVYIISIKNLLKGAGWEVYQSCNASVVAIGNENDNWIGASDITNSSSGTAHSWIILKNSNISSNFSFCIDFSSSSGTSYVGFYCSTAGYQENGTITAKPTVNVGGYENILLANTSQWTGTSSTVKQIMLIYSSDFKNYRFFLDHLGTAQSQWFIEVPKNPPSWFTNPYMACVGTNAQWLDYSVSATTTVTRYNSDFNSTQIKFGIGSVGVGDPLGYSIYGCRQDVSGSYILTPMYLISLTNTYPGIYGELYDMYWTSYLFERCFPCVGGFFKTTTSSMGLIVFGSVAFGNDGNYNGFAV